jgi:hypothetical protein
MIDKRDYSDGNHGDVSMFVGREVEHSPAHGLRTLFVVGLQSATTILEKVREHDCEHVYFGANMSFDLKNNDADGWRDWEQMITKVMESGFLATLDIGTDQLPGLLDGALIEDHRFIPMISVKVPYTKLLNYNTTIKIDDIGFDQTNPGVWCWSLQDLMDRQRFTSWMEYKKDQPI